MVVQNVLPVKTGWKPNDQKGWFTGKQQKQKGWPGMVYVEGGTFTMGVVKDDVMHDWNNTPKRMQVSAFLSEKPKLPITSTENM